MKDGKMTTTDFQRDVESGDWLLVAFDTLLCDDDGAFLALLEKDQRRACAGAMAAAIVNGDESGLVAHLGESECWEEVGRLLDLRFSPAERADIMWLRHVRHSKAGRDLGEINKATAEKMDALLGEAERLRSWAAFPLTPSGMAIMGKAGMLESEVRHWRLPCEHLP